MRMDTCHWKKNQPLAEDYIHRFERASVLYEYDPQAESSWQDRAAWLDERQGGLSGGNSAHREQLALCLKRFNEKLGNTPDALANIEKLADPRTYVVVGGQQAGLFTGPLLVIYKAVTLIQSAQEASRNLNRDVVPVFWIAGEDHDFDEVNHIYALSPQLEVEKLKVEQPPGIRTSISKLAIEGWEDALRLLDASLMPTEFKADLLTRLKEYSEGSRTLVELFGKIMAWLFGTFGLVLLDSDDPGLRRLEAPMFRRLLQDNGRLRDALHEGKMAVENLGYTPQADVADDGANIFVFADNGERILLYREGEVFVDRKRERSFGLNGLLDWCDREPWRFSNNVMTRPLMQEYLFPVLASVLGPGEIAYWGLTRRAFRAFDMRMPILIPRQEFTLIEGTVAKNMGKYALTPDDVVHRFEERKQTWLDEQDTLHLDEKFAAVKEQFLQLYDPLLRLIAGINPGLQKLGQTNAQKIAEQIAFLEAKAKEANLAQFESGLRQLERIRLSLVPLGKPQERVYNVFAYLNKYGHGWLRELVEHPSANDGLHRIVWM